MKEIKTELIWLNKVNGADLICAEYHQKVADKFDGGLYGVIQGSCYGGELEYMAKLWGEDRAHVYGFDTFEDLHPKHLADDPNAFDATCMDFWYGIDQHGTDMLAYDYQRKKFDEMGLNTVILIKGEVGHGEAKGVKKIHYAFMDMDIPKSMRVGYEEIKDKFVKGSYLLIHDAQNIFGNQDWIDEVILDRDKDMWEFVDKHDAELLTIFERK